MCRLERRDQFAKISSMKKFLRVVLLLMTTFSSSFAQDVVYTTLYDNSTFNNKGISTNLAVGSTAGAASVSGNGSASYSIPIPLPPGTNGVVPSVSLEYSSQSGTGVVGMGWSISGLSVISRAPANTYFDGQPGPVELTTNDKFALDGSRMILTSGTNATSGAQYATEVESFAKITAKGIAGNGPKFFEIVTKDGTKMEYGKSADSRFMDQAGSTVMFWRLNRVVQPDSNYVEFVYNNTDRDSRISEIRYTGNSATGLTPYNKIIFSYKVRQTTGFSDIRTLYEAGSTIVSKYLLDKITVTAETQTFKTFQLSYGHDNVNSYLKSVTETGSDNTSLNPTIFKYGDVPTEVTSGNNVVSGANIQAISGDFDGDGKREILSAHESTTALEIPFFDSFTVYKSNGTGYTSIYTQALPTSHTIVNKQEIPNSKSFVPSDFTGDGNDDILTLNIANLGTYLRVDGVTIYQSVNGGTSFTPSVRQIQPNYNRVPPNNQFFYIGDFDGDGITEYISILGNSNGLYSPFLCVNSIGGACGAITVPGAGLAAGSWHTAGRITALDINADGKTDLMIEYGSQYEVFTIQGYQAVRLAAGSLPAKSDLNFIGDFNGDGKTDLIFTDKEYKTITKFTSTGNGFVSTPLVLTMSRPEAIAPTLQSQEDNFAIGDYNGDGKSDIHYNWGRRLIFPNPDPEIGNDIHLYFGQDIYYSQGDSFKYKQLSYTHEIYEGYGRPSTVQFVADVPTDLNGDGKTDLVYFSSSLISYKLFNKDGRDKLIHKVSNGLNHVTEWTYKSLVDGGTFYSKGTASTFPVNTIQPAALLTFEIKAANGNGIGGFGTTQYSYEGARLHRSGKGFLGFAKITAIDAMGFKTVSETELNSTYYAAVPKKTTISHATLGTKISETTMTNVFVTPGAKRFWVKTTGISENRALEGATLTTTNVYDEANGNITSSTVMSPSETIATSTIYGAYPGTILNKPTLVTVTKTRTGQPAFVKSTGLTYYPNGKVKTKVDFSGKDKAVTATYSYNTLGNLETTTISATGLTSRSNTAVFDLKGRYPEKTIDALLQESTATYDPKWGQPTNITGIDALSTTYTYDGFGRTKTTTVTSDYVKTNTLSWDISANRVWKNATTYSQSGKSAVTQWFDQLGRQVRTQTNAFDNSAIESNTVYDGKGNVYEEQQPHTSAETAFITTTRTYDDFNRPSKIDNGNALGATSFEYTYSAGNTTVKSTSPSGESSKTTDLAGMVITATDKGGTLSYTYFSHGGVKEVKNENVTTVSNTYDEYGRQNKLIDANAGTTEYLYNAFGELTWQKNAAGAAYDISNDVLGRPITRGGTGTEGTTTTEYYNNLTDGTSRGKVKKVTGFAANNNTQYEYNNRGLLQKVTETIDNIAHVTQYTYNVYGDVLTTTYPSGLVVTNTYTANGYLETIAGAGATLYTTSSMNGQGQVTAYNKGKTATQQQGKNSTITYVNGYVTAYTTPSVQDYQLVWDYQKGNLTSRKDARASVNKTETFLYDNLNRLTSAKVGTGSAFTATYASNGNISSKTDLGNYTYTNSKFNAVTGFDNVTKAVSISQQDITYTAFNQPATIAESNYLLTYTYGADYNRIKSELKLGSSTVQNTRYYFAGGFEKDVTGTTTRYLQYIAGPAGLVAIVESNGAVHTPHYTYTDHLGSILTVTNSTFSTIEAEQSFDAWGRRRNTTSWALEPTQIKSLPVWLIRGYTGHEHLDKFGLINMNGRLYDPATGRMLSPDNYIQDPHGTQSYNRYSYAHNNPLVYTDPDGNNPIVSMVIGAVIGGIVNGAMYDIQGKNFFQGFWRGAIAGAVAGLTGYYAPIGAAGGLAYGAASGALTGGIGAALNGTDFWKGVGLGAATGAVFGGIFGGIEAKKLGANWLTGSRPIRYMPVKTDVAAGSTPAPFSNEYLVKLKNANFKDIKQVSGMSMTHRPSNVGVSGDDFLVGGVRAHAATRANIWTHGKTSNVYFAKSAFASKELLTETMAHEFAHAIHNSLGLQDLSHLALDAAIDGIDNQGHFAIGVMENQLIKINGWQRLPLLNYGFDQPLDNLYEPIKHLARKIVLP